MTSIFNSKPFNQRGGGVKKTLYLHVQKQWIGCEPWTLGSAVKCFNPLLPIINRIEAENLYKVLY